MAGRLKSCRNVSRSHVVLLTIVFFQQVCIQTTTEESSGAAAAAAAVAERKQEESSAVDFTINTTNTPLQIFHCGTKFGGFRQYKALLESIFPEYGWRDLGSIDQEPKGPGFGQRIYRFNYFRIPSSPADIFLNHWGSYCPVSVMKFLHQFFEGKTVWVFPESELKSTSTPRSIRPTSNRNDYIQLGPSHQAPRNHIPLTYMQVVFWADYGDRRDALLVHESKPKNTGKHFLIYANSNCVSFRENAYYNLSKLGKEVHYGGFCNGQQRTIGVDSNRTRFNQTIVGIQTPHQKEERISGVFDVASRNSDLFRNYRFCLVMEHTADSEWYITEKILNAFMAGCIPIYYGPKPEIFEIFNPKAFVYYEQGATKALEQIRDLENNQEIYHKMLFDEPILADGNETIRRFFSFSEEYGEGYVKDQIRSMVGLKQMLFVT